ncbi:hypothetical protein OV203_50605 [Nannocystis sp. ILAH1]|uniref:hypothetical protein n=1 Tax=unclassified Nannocystis TaxID=2627009 RepID=UPI002272131C|nr:MULTISPECIES: hypothetical protein [unclassified Nannocystis]MCY0995478.1 hypothetical protein [Nannocystis sp. ILAH1]MCY1065130.1 hypothetical protein [Nannocystis sp. RBIL2]
MSVTTATAPCEVVGEEEFESVRQRCGGLLVSTEERTPAPSLRLEIVPDPLVVRSGALARFAVRVTNAEPRPVRLVLNCPLRTRVRAADGTSNLPPEEEGELLCAMTGLAVDLRPGATLRFDAEVETRTWVRMDPGPDANGWTLGPDPAWEPGPALPPGSYALEVDLPSVATRDGAFMTVGGALRLE